MRTPARVGRVVYLALVTLVVAFPAGLALVSIARAIARFGLSETLSSVPPVLVVTLGPPLVWVTYLARPPVTEREWVWLGAAAALSFSAIALSPLALWSAPLFLALAPEAVRCWLAARHRRRNSSAPECAATS